MCNLQEFKNDRQLWRDFFAFWILGICNHFGYYVMLRSADDIIKKIGDKVEESEKERLCTLIKLPLVLIAIGVPELIIKIIGPFSPLCIKTRIGIAFLVSAGGSALICLGNNVAVAYIGISLISLSSGLGESSLLGYASRFDKVVIASWSSGTGLAGIIGSIIYNILNKELKILLIVLIVPLVIELFAFFLILRTPKEREIVKDSGGCFAFFSCMGGDSGKKEIVDDGTPIGTIIEKRHYFYNLQKYFCPLATVYYFQIFVTSGLMQLIWFDKVFVAHKDQYTWLYMAYQIGAFVSKSSICLMEFEAIYLFGVVQFVLAMYFLVETVTYVTPLIYVTLVVAVFIGLVLGGAYVNTLYKIAKKIAPVQREFASAVVVLASPFGLLLAAISSAPIHDIICKSKKPIR